MARKERPVPAGGSEDGAVQRTFVNDLLFGRIAAKALVETTVPGPPGRVRQARFTEQGTPAPDVEIKFTKRRLTKLEYDEP